MFLKKLLPTLLILFACNLIVNAQDSTSNKSSYFKAAVNYLTNSVYNGRKDSVVLPYITPSIGYYDKSGVYISGSLSYLAATNNSRIDVFTTEIGYDFTINNKLSGGIYGSKYFYNNNSTSVTSQTKGSIGGSLTYDPGIITFSSGIDVSFASKADVNVSAALGHSFYIGEKNNEWGITPTISTNLGTQNSYQDYVKKRKSKGSGNSTVQTNSPSSFGILDYELSLPITYEGNKWGLFLTPIYAIPQNPISIAASTGSGYTTEKLENVFYAQFGVYVKF
ncbi:MAG: hypothetical protein H7101_10025 [Deinococcales bacterium]|nr:hypothetical protein [Chitinophagaceae bacterium]